MNLPIQPILPLTASWTSGLETDLQRILDYLNMDQQLLLDDLDQRQNAVLDRLAELNASIEALLKECTAARDQATDSLKAGAPLVRSVGK